MVRRHLMLCLLCLVVLTGNAAKKRQTPPVRVTHLLTERMLQPMSVDTPTPRLGWTIEADSQLKDVMQTSYHLLVASSREKAEALEGDLWDTTVSSDQSQWVKYGGKPLRSNTRCYWRVKVSTTQGGSDWSDIAMWNVGLLTESDWQGQWIGLDHAMPWDKEEEHSQLSARYLRTTFDADAHIRQATLYISGLGMYEVFVNGQKADIDVNGHHQVLAPVPTDYRKTVIYNAFDVTPLLKTKNALAVVLGNGRYYTMQQKKKPYKITQFGYPKVRANLIIEYEDGQRKVISTNDKWKINADGPIRSNNEYDGEIYDARKQLHGWTMPDYEDTDWPTAERVAIPSGTLRGSMTPNMTITERITPPLHR